MLVYAEPRSWKGRANLGQRSLAALRKQVEPVEATALGRFLPAWQGVGSTARGVGRLIEVADTRHV